MFNLARPLDELLEAVFNGQYEGFRAYLKHNNVLELDLTRGVVNRSLGHLSLALQSTPVRSIILKHNQTGDRFIKDFGENLVGTEVTTVDLAWNQISAQGAKEFVKTLKGTRVRAVGFANNQIDDVGLIELAENLKGIHVSTIDISWNQVTVHGTKMFAKNIPDTFLTDVFSNHMNKELARALNLNKIKIQSLLVFSPYYSAALRLLPETEKAKHFNLSVESLASEEGSLRYAGGIVMHSCLPNYLQQKILGYLPLMMTQNGINKTEKYNHILQTFHPKGLEVEQISDIAEIEEKTCKMKISSDY
jgi:hypothetical protein